ncbi:MAG TPA: ATP-dependent sacrificial sulfur transferase LarE [Amycolatopsis sp.]|nr:ATP-dependent sacrificial sulfur transferase LarE [Amycolatopsis sp.]
MTESLDRLRERLSRESKLVVAFSGGVDSALLATVAQEVLGDGALAVTAVSASLPEAERIAARGFARERGLRHLEVHTDELDRPEYVANGGNRCFHCKSALFDALEPLAELLGARIAVGTNVDDLSDHRPGQAAAARRAVLAPLVDARLTKADVRAASGVLGLPTAEKPAAACLASRVAYGDPVTTELLGRIETAEAALHELGLRRCRVRAHANGTVARLEVPEPELATALRLRAAITAAVCGAGFVFCALDLAGLRSGSMNALLPLTPVRHR